jgi:hypothetical protein
VHYRKVDAGCEPYLLALYSSLRYSIGAGRTRNERTTPGSRQRAPAWEEGPQPQHHRNSAIGNRPCPCFDSKPDFSIAGLNTLPRVGATNLAYVSVVPKTANASGDS